MIKFVFLLFFSIASLASSEIDVYFEKSSIHQGEIAEASLEVSLSELENISPQDLKEQMIGETLYILSLSPFVKKEGENKFISDAKVVFAQVPDKLIFPHKINKKQFELKLNNVNVVPTQAPQDLVWSTFTISPRLKLGMWFSVLLIAMLAVGSLAYIWHKKFKVKQERKAYQRRMKNKLLSCSSYDDVVELWLIREDIYREFPKVEVSFKELTKVLNQYQFKPHQNDIEKERVMSAYKDFKSKAEEGMNGI